MSVKPRLVWSREYWDCGEVFSLCLLSQDWFDHMARAPAFIPADGGLQVCKTLLSSGYCKVSDRKLPTLQ